MIVPGNGRAPSVEALRRCCATTIPPFQTDANATVSDEAHNASLNALFIRFADVFTTDEIVDLLTAASAKPMRRVGRRAASTHGE